MKLKSSELSGEGALRVCLCLCLCLCLCVIARAGGTIERLQYIHIYTLLCAIHHTSCIGVNFNQLTYRSVGRSIDRSRPGPCRLCSFDVVGHASATDRAKFGVLHARQGRAEQDKTRQEYNMEGTIAAEKADATSASASVAIHCGGTRTDRGGRKRTRSSKPMKCWLMRMSGQSVGGRYDSRSE